MAFHVKGTYALPRTLLGAALAFEAAVDSLEEFRPTERFSDLSEPWASAHIFAARARVMRGDVQDARALIGAFRHRLSSIPEPARTAWSRKATRILARAAQPRAPPRWVALTGEDNRP